MNRISYVLFGLMILGLGFSLYLYDQSRKKSIMFSDRVATVNRVLLLLERTEHLKNILRKTIFENLDEKDEGLVFSPEEKYELDSILTDLHNIALYQEQRLRIDTIRSIVNSNYVLLIGKSQGRSILDYNPGNTEVIARAKQFSRMRLQEQRESFERFESNVDFWSTTILLISGLVFAIGVWSTAYENRAKQKLKNLHESVLSNASVGICVYEVHRDNDGNLIPTIAFSNYGAVSKINSEEGETVVDLCRVPIENRDLTENIKVVLSTGKSVVKELQHQANGTFYWFLTNLSRVSENKVAFYYQDISRIKDYESTLKRKVNELEAVNKDLEQFAHATSHDLREPFRKIQVMTDLIQKNHNMVNNPKYLDAIQRASNKGSLLVEQILNYSKVQFDRSELTRVDLNKVVAQVIEDFDLIILEKNAQVDVVPLPFVHANRVQMTQLFSNMIGNSLKFVHSDRKPTITISCAETDSQGIPELNPASTYYRITIADNGVGFDDAYADKIFDAFSRLHHYQEFPGFGLGLSLCKKVVLNHGGAIRAFSKLNDGSTFQVYLPKS